MNSLLMISIAFLLSVSGLRETAAFASRPFISRNTVSRWCMIGRHRCGTSVGRRKTRRNQLLWELRVIQHQLGSDSDRVVSIVTEPVHEDVPTTLSDAIRRFFFGPERGPLLIAVSLVATLAWRMQLFLNVSATAGITTTASLGFDLLVFVSMVVFWWFQEHEMHLHLLHSKFDWTGKKIHEEHHNKPYFHISIDPAGLMMGWLAAVHLLLRCVLPLPLALSATLGYGLSGLWYEWAHYIVHTRVRPRHGFWKQLRDHHIHHHLVDPRYWLGFSVPAIDDFFGTNPSLEQVKQQRRDLQRESY